MHLPPSLSALSRSTLEYGMPLEQTFEDLVPAGWSRFAVEEFPRLGVVATALIPLSLGSEASGFGVR